MLKSVAAEFKKQFPERPGLFTIDDKTMGGWDKVQKRFFDPRTGIMARIQRQVGGERGDEHCLASPFRPQHGERERGSRSRSVS